MLGLFLTLFTAVAYIYWLARQKHSKDITNIEIFAEQHRLRIISVDRSPTDFRKNFSHLFRRLGSSTSTSNTARLYDIAARDFEGNNVDIHVAFDSLLSSGKLQVLRSRGLTIVPPNSLIDSTQSCSKNNAPKLSWYDWLVMVIGSAAFSGFLFCGILGTYLSSPSRPVFPEPALGFTNLFRAKYGVYGTYFEYLAVTYGPWATWGLLGIATAFFNILQIKQRTRAYRQQILLAAVISMMLYFVIWRVFFSGIKS